MAFEKLLILFALNIPLKSIQRSGNKYFICSNVQCVICVSISEKNFLKMKEKQQEWTRMKAIRNPAEPWGGWSSCQRTFHYHFWVALFPNWQIQLVSSWFRLFKKYFLSPDMMSTKVERYFVNSAGVSQTFPIFFQLQVWAIIFKVSLRNVSSILSRALAFGHCLHITFISPSWIW